MTTLCSVARQYGLIVVLALLPSSGARAQSSGIHFNAAFDLSVDCDQPKELHAAVVHGEGVGAINPDKTGTADLTISAITTSTIHFDARLGAAQPAPGGSAAISLIGGNRLRLIWDLPNNQVVTVIAVAGQSCTVSVDYKLKYGNRQYSLFDGQSFYFCKKPQLLRSTCSVQ